MGARMTWEWTGAAPSSPPECGVHFSDHPGKRCEPALLPVVVHALGPAERGRLGLCIETAIEAELERRGAPPPGVGASSDLDGSLSDQLFRARLVGHLGLGIAVHTLEGITNLAGALDAEDSAVLRWWAAATDERPVRLELATQNRWIGVYGPPIPLYRAIESDLVTGAEAAPHVAPEIRESGAAMSPPAFAPREDDPEPIPATMSQPPRGSARAMAALFDDEDLRDLRVCLESTRFDVTTALPISSAERVLETPARADVGEPAAQDAEPATDVAAGDEPVVMVTEPAVAEPVVMMSEPVVMMSESVVTISEPAVAEPVATVAEPVVMASEPVASEPDVAAASGASSEVADAPVIVDAPSEIDAALETPITQAPPVVSAPIAPASPRREDHETIEREVIELGSPLHPDAATEWRGWMRDLDAARGPKPLAVVERMFTSAYVPLCDALARGIASPEAARVLDVWSKNFAKSYADAFDALRHRGKRPTMVLDVPEVSLRVARLHGARNVQLVLVDGLRFDLGLRMNEHLRELVGQRAALTERFLMWSALPTTTAVQLELIGRGAAGLKEIDDGPSSDVPVGRGRSASVLRRVKAGPREVMKLDLAEAQLAEAGGPLAPRLDRLGAELAEAIADHLLRLPPRTLAVVFGDHGFTLDPVGEGTGAARSGGSAPEEVLVPAYAWLTGEVH